MKKKKHLFIYVVLFMSFLGISSCSYFRYFKTVKVGRDLALSSLFLGVKTARINAFINALMQAIGNKERINFSLINMDQFSLQTRLDSEHVGAIITLINPNYETAAKYDFSECFLKTGPVLVVPEYSKISSLEQLSGKTVCAFQYDSSVLVLEQVSDIFIKLCQNVAVGMDELNVGSYDGLVAPILEVLPLINTMYKGKLKIVSVPLTAEGFRLMTLKKNSHLIDSFNKGFNKVMKTGRYEIIKKEFTLL